ncbi:MAG: hypothetical protein DRO06_02255 [Thermoproteota archaeon]|nr:MAG: hypothetical protein DRO06_02255 [Candidatus Korarchaeota archaeon]
MVEPGVPPPAAAVAVALALGVGIGLIGYALGRFLSPSREFPRKRRRYECGNPPAGRARGILVVQYYPYLIVFLTVEPVLIYVALALLAGPWALPTAALMVGALLPPLIFALRTARRLELWSAG